MKPLIDTSIAIIENAAFFRDWLESEGRRRAGEEKRMPAGKTATVELNWQDR